MLGGLGETYLWETILKAAILEAGGGGYFKVIKKNSEHKV